MADMFGPITASTLVFLVTLVTQFIKDRWPDFTARQIQLLALLLSGIFLLPYHVLTTFMQQPGMTWLELAWMAFSGVVYTIMGWLAAIGAYEVGIKKRG